MSQPKVRWLKDRVVVKPIPLQSRGGIAIPQTAQTPEVGIVKDLSSKVKDLRLGDRVLYPRFIGEKIPIQEDDQLPGILTEYLVFSVYQIIAVFNEN